MAAEEPTPRTHVALIQLPWAALERPSVQLGLVQAHLRDAGIPSKVIALNVELASAIGPARYVLAGQQVARFVGEWLFARALFGDEVPDYVAWLEAEWPRAPRPEIPVWADTLRALERELPPLLDAFVDGLAERLGGEPRVLGLSCTHDQLLAALAVSRRVVARYPGCRVVLGGAQVEGTAGEALIDAFPWVHHVVDGEADTIVVPLFEALLAGRPPDLPGVQRGERSVVRAGAEHRLDDMDQLPIPSYRDWLEAQPQRVSRRLELPIELSRGCWWAVTHAICTFCGLLPGELRYRSKSHDRIVEEIAQLARESWLLDFMATDTLIPPRAMPALEAAHQRVDFRLFAELRTQLSLKNTRRLAASGVRTAQPGVESLDTRLLGLMDKGTTRVDNVAFLKSCVRWRIDPTYNILYGIPGETEADYRRMIDRLALLHHLPPPEYLLGVDLAKHSPYHAAPERYGIAGLRPLEAYRFLFPPDGVDLQALAWLFDGELTSVLGTPIVAELYGGLTRWCAAFGQGARLTLRRGPGFVRVLDTRAPADHRAAVFDGALAEVLNLTEEPIQRPALAARATHDADAIGAAVEQLEAMGLLLVDGDQLLALPVPADTPAWGMPVRETVWVEGGLPRAG